MNKIKELIKKMLDLLKKTFMFRNTDETSGGGGGDNPQEKEDDQPEPQVTSLTAESIAKIVKEAIAEEKRKADEEASLSDLEKEKKGRLEAEQKLQDLEEQAKVKGIKAQIISEAVAQGASPEYAEAVSSLCNTDGDIKANVVKVKETYPNLFIKPVDPKTVGAGADGKPPQTYTAEEISKMDMETYIEKRKKGDIK